MTQKVELLAAFDEAWSFKWESIESVLGDISHEEAHYQHPCFASVEREKGYPLPGTILTHITHLGECYCYYRGLIIHRPNLVDDPAPFETQDIKEAITNLRKCRESLRECINALSEDQFEDKIYNLKSVAQEVRMVVRHDAWHSGQIALVRRLYRHSLTSQ